MIPSHYQAFVDSLLSILSSDDEYIGLAAGGSWRDGQMDQFSDIDLVIVHQSETIDLVRRKALAEAAGNLLACFTGEHVGEPRLLICLYGNPLLHVDLKFVALPDLRTRVEDPVVLWERDGKLTELIAATEAHFPHPDYQWLEDRFWVWVHYAATKIGRGELFETLTFFSFVQQMVLGPLALIKNGSLPKGVRKVETILPLPDQQALQRTLAEYNRESCLNALEEAVTYYRELRSSLMPSTVILRLRAEEEVMAYLTELRLSLSLIEESQGLDNVG